MRAAHQVLVDDDVQRESIEESLRASAAIRGLEAAAVKRFGEAGKTVTGYPDGSRKVVEGRLKISIDGDVATVSLRDAVLPLKLRKIDQKWKVDLSDSLQDPRFLRAARRMPRVADVAKAVAAEIRAGRFASAEEAKAAFTRRRPDAVNQ